MVSQKVSASSNKSGPGIFFIGILAILSSSFSPGISAADTAEIKYHTEWARMRDGVLLASEVYLPAEAKGPFPVVLMRNPYNGGQQVLISDNVRALVSRGYAFVNQDVRGTSRSHGKFNPFFQEQNDGYDAVEWAAKQPWSNGKVGLWGASYLGVTAMQAASTRPPHLAAVVAVVTSSDYHDNWTYVNGVFDLWFGQSWLAATFSRDHLQRSLAREGLAPAVIVERGQQYSAQAQDNLPKAWLPQVPLMELAEFKTSAPYYYDWLAHPDYDAYWAKVDLEKRYSSINVPVLVVGGWYDIFSVGSVKNFIGLRSSGGSQLARKNSKLIMAPICHGVCNEALKFNPDFKSADIHVDWWDRWLKDIDNDVEKQPAVKLYVMAPPDTGDEDGGFWITADQYPLPDTERIKFNLGSGGQANTRNGNGTLDAKAASHGPPDHFVYDPGNPVPTRGGNLCCNDQIHRSGPFDQSEIELREDVLVYTSAPLRQDLTVVGPVTVKFWAATSAPDTDFTAKLVHVRPDGFAHNVLDRIVTSRLRKGSKSKPSPITPNQPHEYALELGDTANVFKAGHRIRLEISSSNFPHYARNPNTGRPAALEGELRSARQTILHDGRHPSYLELPVIKNLER